MVDMVVVFRVNQLTVESQRVENKVALQHILERDKMELHHQIILVELVVEEVVGMAVQLYLIILLHFRYQDRADQVM